ncbi:MAG TPA: hypothetical protein VIX83_06660 [Candidatus Cybelea sp.]
MPAKKSPARKKAGPRKKTATRKKAAAPIAAAKKAAKRAATGARKTLANPKRTVRKVAGRVQRAATRAHDVGEAVTTAGEVLKQTADIVDSLAKRAGAATSKGAASGRRKKR